MRILFTTWAWPSHLYALTPLAWACRAAGHEVLFASEPDLLGEIARTGLPGTGVGTPVDTVGMVREYLTPAEGDGRGPRALRMVLAHAESMVDGLTELVRDWRADLLVHDPTVLAGPVAAAAGGIPAVRHLYGTDLLAKAAPLLPKVLGPLADRVGAGKPDPIGVATVDPTPPSLQVPVGYRRLPMRWIPFNGTGTLPGDAAGRGDRPRVCVTWGHTMAKLDPQRFLAGFVADALHDLDAEVVLAVSQPQAELLGPVPGNARVLVDTPLHRLLPGCDLVVGHGGAATILTGLSFGLPLLLVPQLPDHAGHSAQVAGRGAGVVLDREDATAPAIRAAVQRLLGDAPERAAAGELRAEILRQPTPAALVSTLESLTAPATKKCSRSSLRAGASGGT